MCKNLFRTLEADEIELRVASCSEKGVSWLLYKTSRTDVNLLDETVGPMNWKCEYLRENQNCKISIWDEDKKQWITKEDTGTESKTEAEKGLASDSFKRAGFKWGIGIELYTSPFIWTPADKVKIVRGDNGKLTCRDKLFVSEITYNEKRKIDSLTLVNRNGAVVFTWKKNTPTQTTSVQAQTTTQNTPAVVPEATAPQKKMADKFLVTEIEALARSNGVSFDYILKSYKVNSFYELTEKQAGNLVNNFHKCVEAFKKYAGIEDDDDFELPYK